MFSQSFTITHLYRFINLLYFMKHDPEVKIFNSDKYFLYFTRNFSQLVSLLTSLRKQDFLFDISLRYPTLEVQYSKILSGGIDFIS